MWCSVCGVVCLWYVCIMYVVCVSSVGGWMYVYVVWACCAN